MKTFPKLTQLFSSKFRSITGHASMETLDLYCRRFYEVEGWKGQQNDVIICRKNQIVNEITENVIYFGGDVQDYSERMQKHRDNHRYLEWNLENTARIIAKKFPSSQVYVIKPKSMYLGTFSIYSHFVETSELGIPTFKQTAVALPHLRHLFLSAVHSSVQSAKEENNKNSVDIDTDGEIKRISELPIHIIGFSKGCVVLNQMVMEMASQDNSELDFLRKVVKMYWLDGGHNGGKDTYITNKDIIKALCSFSFKVVTCVTPYQVKDPMRAWIGKEHRKFVDNIRALNGSVQNIELFFDQPASIENHFLVLREFTQ